MKLGKAVAYAKGGARVITAYENYVTGNRSVAKERDALVEIMTRPERVRTGSFSASSAGTCKRRRQLQALGTEQAKIDGRAGGIFANGDYVHLRWQVAGLLGGWLKEAEVAVRWDDGMMLGTMDGWLEWDAVLEIKSINERGFKEVTTFGPKREHVRQIHAYFLGSGLKVAHLIYENKNTQETKEFVVYLDEAILEEVKLEFLELKVASEERKLLPMLEGCKKQEGFDYRWCPVKATCPHATYESPNASVTPRTFSIRPVSPPSKFQ